ncbi:MAG: hypothetical protein ACRETT_02580 [Steroidobacteraceae bacterium]
MTDRRGQQIIDGFRVQFVDGFGWVCSCEQFEEQKFCAHADKAAAIAKREAQAKRRGGRGEPR